MFHDDFHPSDSQIPNAHSPEDWNAIGCALCEKGEYKDAIIAFDRAIALNSHDSYAWNYRGNALSASQRYAEALGSYDRAVAIQPDYHAAWFNRGLLFAEMGAYGNALESYNNAISLSENNETHCDPRYLHAKEDIWIKKKLFVA